MVAAAIAVGSAAGLGGSALASGAQSSAASQSADIQQQMYQNNLANESPYLSAGKSSLGSIMGGLNLGASTGGIGQGQFTHQFNASDLNSNLAPNYSFQLGQGQGATNNAASVTGGMVGGNALKGLQDYTQNFAGNAYQNAFNNYNTNQGNIFSRLSSIAGLGQNAAAGVGNNGVQTGANVGSSLMAGGAANASGYTGAANALAGGASMYALSQMMNQPGTSLPVTQTA